MYLYIELVHRKQCRVKLMLPLSVVHHTAALVFGFDEYDSIFGSNFDTFLSSTSIRFCYNSFRRLYSIWLWTFEGLVSTMLRQQAYNNP